MGPWTRHYERYDLIDPFSSKIVSISFYIPKLVNIMLKTTELERFKDKWQIWVLVPVFNEIHHHQLLDSLSTVPILPHAKNYENRVSGLTSLKLRWQIWVLRPVILKDMTCLTPSVSR